MSDSTSPQGRTLAERIATCLFTNGVGEKARRLVLELEDGRNGGAWSESSVVNQLTAALFAPIRADAEQLDSIVEWLLGEADARGEGSTHPLRLAASALSAAALSSPPRVDVEALRTLIDHAHALMLHNWRGDGVHARLEALGYLREASALASPAPSATTRISGVDPNG